jgi:protein phosphatase
MEPRPTPPNPLPSFRAPGVIPRGHPPLDLEVAACTDAGLVRSDNQDSYLVIEPGPAVPWALLAVCDGMGGAAGGDVASRTAVAALREVMTAADAPTTGATGDALGRRLLHGVQEASRRIFALAGRRRELHGMGTTATACALAGDVLYIAQVGDSRAYVYREGALTKVTRDQTLATLLMEQGQLAPEDVDTYPHGHVILQAVGTSERVEVDLTQVRVARGDVVLVCSDGLYGPVAHDTLRAALEREPSPDAAAEALVRLALAAGGPDNVTCIVARVSGPALASPAGPPSPEKARLDADTTTPLEESAQGFTAQPLGGEPSAEDEETRGMGIIAQLAAVFRRRRQRS